jgi:hypothetical protein
MNPLGPNELRVELIGGNESVLRSALRLLEVLGQHTESKSEPCCRLRRSIRLKGRLEMFAIQATWHTRQVRRSRIAGLSSDRDPESVKMAQEKVAQLNPSRHKPRC